MPKMETAWRIEVIRRANTCPSFRGLEGVGTDMAWVGRAALTTFAAIAVVGGMCFLSPSTRADAGTIDGGGARAAQPTGHARIWTAPRVLARCAVAGGPEVVFPSEAATRPIGDGAISWFSDPAPCGSRSGHRGVSVAVLGSADRAILTGVQSFGDQSGPALAAIGATRGRIALAAGGGSGGTAVRLLQGYASDPSAWPPVLVGPSTQFALVRAYLGDVAIASAAPGPSIAVLLERFFQSRFGRPRSIAIGAGAVTALTAAMDYRSDVLVAWQQDRSIYACMLWISGRTGPCQRVGPSAARPQIDAVVSDNEHGMIAWSSTDVTSTSTPTTRTYLSLSAAGVRFRAPRTLASFADPERLGRHPGSIALERLSTENVILAWTVLEGGHYLIRTAPAVFAGSRPSRILSERRSQAVLDGLATGPAGEAVALWRTAPRLPGGALNMHRAEVWAARASIASRAGIALSDTQMIAAAGQNVAPAIAVDPANDRAVAAWLVLGAGGRIEYAVGAGSSAYRPRPKAAAAGLPPAGPHRLRIALAAAVAAVMTACLVAVALRGTHRLPDRR